MKKILLSVLIVTFCFSQNSFAQDDDVYFVPSKHKEKEATPQRNLNSDYALIENGSQDYEYDNWADNRRNDRDIDEYNRRKPMEEQPVEQENRSYEERSTANGTCTERIIRFHSPSVGVYVSSPYYSDYVDVWFDPWFYDPWYSYSYIGWNSCWHSSFYWGHSWYWNDPWYWHNPWYGPYYGWYYPYYGYNHHYRPIPYGANRGPHGGYVYYGNSSRYGSGYSSSHTRYGGDRYNNSRPSRDYGNRYNNDRPSRNHSDRYNNSRPSRDYGNGNTSRPSRDYNSRNDRPSREIGNGNNSRPSREPSRNVSRPSRDYSSPSRSHNSTPSRSYNSSPSRSYNSGFSGGGHGGSRNFGGGGGHSRGGRR